MEVICEAAVLFKVYLPEHGETRTIMLTGWRHSDCFETASKLFPGRYHNSDCVEGFFTTARRFLNRYDAKDFAIENGQLTHETKYRELYSEDLW